MVNLVTRGALSPWRGRCPVPVTKVSGSPLTAYPRGSANGINRHVEPTMHLAQTWTLWALADPFLAPLMLVFDSIYHVLTPTPCWSWGFGNELELLPSRSSPSGGRDLPVKRELAPQLFDGKLTPPLSALTLQNTPQRLPQGFRNLSSERWICPPVGSWPSLISCLPLPTPCLSHSWIFSVPGTW